MAIEIPLIFQGISLMELVESSTGDTQKHHLLLILSSNTLIVVINLIKCNVDIQTQNIK